MFGILTVFYHLKVVLMEGVLNQAPRVLLAYAVVYWVVSNNARDSRSVFLAERREQGNMKAKHEAALLELQASAGMSRLYHVLKNILVGIHAVMDMSSSRTPITPEMRRLVTDEAQQGIDFIMQRFAFIAIAKGTCA